MPAACGTNRIEVADEISDGNVGCGELLDVAILSADPGDRRVVAGFGDQIARVLGDRDEGIVVDLTAGDDRHGVVEECDERAQDARLRLSAQPEQNEVVLGQNGVGHLRNDGVLVADHAGEERSALT